MAFIKWKWREKLLRHTVWAVAMFMYEKNLVLVGQFSGKNILIVLFVDEFQDLWSPLWTNFVHGGKLIILLTIFKRILCSQNLQKHINLTRLPHDQILMQPVIKDIHNELLFLSSNAMLYHIILELFSNWMQKFIFMRKWRWDYKKGSVLKQFSLLKVSVLKCCLDIGEKITCG